MGEGERGGAGLVSCRNGCGQPKREMNDETGVGSTHCNELCGREVFVQTTSRAVWGGEMVGVLDGVLTLNYGDQAGSCLPSLCQRGVGPPQPKRGESGLSGCSGVVQGRW